MTSSALRRNRRPVAEHRVQLVHAFDRVSALIDAVIVVRCVILFQFDPAEVNTDRETNNR